MIYKGKNNEYIRLQKLLQGEHIDFDTSLESPLTIIWTKDDNCVVDFDGTHFTLEKNTIICLTKFYNLKFASLKSANLLKFNREFYCVLDHDKEVGCKGVLFFGANQMPYFRIPDDELETFETVWKMFEFEMATHDEMQLEMLQAMLKRFLILCTRVYKNDNHSSPMPSEDSDIVREFNYLVELHFREKHSVQEYADLLNKSPKTLSNIFSKVSDKSPLQIIHERIAIEARRLLIYSDRSIKEIAFDLHFEDIQSFSRFFKKMEKISPSEFRNNELGRIANS